MCANLQLQKVISGGSSSLLAKILFYMCMQLAGVFGMTVPQDSQNLIQLVDGRNGKPIVGVHMVVFGGASLEEVRLHKARFDLVTNTEGLAAIPALLPSIQWVQVWPDAYMLCQDKPNNNSFKISEITSVGLNASNTCGELKKGTLRGRLIVFARPAHWWEKMRW